MHVHFQITLFSFYATKVSSFGQLVPQFLKSDFFPWPVNQLHVALVRDPLPPPPPRQIHTSCLWIMINRTGPLESSLLWGCVTPQLFFLITLGFMTLGVWHERDSGIAGAENSGDFLKRESSKVILKWGTIPHSCIKCGVPSQTERSSVQKL